MKGIFGLAAVFIVSFMANAFAAANLPIVSLSKGTVSARELFGEKVQSRTVLSRKSEPVKPVKSSDTVAKKKEFPAKSAKNVDVLIPQRPTSSLWVKNDARAVSNEAEIRIPSPDEFVKISDPFELPEEVLPTKTVEIARAKVSENPVKTANLPVKSSVKTANQIRQARKAQLDNQIKKMVERQNQLTLARARSAVEKFSQIEEVQPVANSVKTVEVAPVKAEPKVVAAPEAPVDTPLNNMSPRELKRALYKSYISENKHLSAYSYANDFDTESDNWQTTVAEGFVGNDSIDSTSAAPKTLEIRISFSDSDSALSKDNYNLLSEYAAMMANNPKRAVQVSVSEDAVKNEISKKLAAKRLALIQQVLIDSGVQESRIIPVLADRDDNSFVLRVISTDQFKILKQTERDMFGDKKSQTTTKSLSW